MEKLQEKLKDPVFRKSEGFPIGEDENILALSDPPYFTACPNPFLGDMIQHYGKPYLQDDVYSCEPYASDVTVGKNDTIYMAHSYHTKVPHQAILRYILHYTKPGDIILDGFCGSGMTGVAAAFCADLSPEEKAAIEREMPDVQWGRRIAILNDLSPAAAFIEYNYNVKVDPAVFLQEANDLLEVVEQECGPLYRTQHNADKRSMFGYGEEGQPGVINYCVWSEVMTCPQCGREIVFFDHAVDVSAHPMSVRKEFPCPGCGVRLTKRALDAFMETVFDPLLKRNVGRVKRVPVSLKYMVGKKHFSKLLDGADATLLSSVHLDKEVNIPTPFEMPTGG